MWFAVKKETVSSYIQPLIVNSISAIFTFFVKILMYMMEALQTRS